MKAKRGPLGDERRDRGPETPPTRGVLVTGSLVRVSSAAAAGCGALFVLLPVLALIGRLGFPDDPPDFVPVFGGPLIAASLGIAVFLIVLGYSLTFQQLALADMYAAEGDSPSLRNAVEVRGPVSRTPFFPAVATSIVIGSLLLATAGVLLAASAWPAVATILLILGILSAPAVLALIAVGRRWRRTAGERLPAQALGEQGHARLLLGDADTKRRQQAKARDRAEATDLDRASIPVRAALVIAVFAVMSPSLSPTAPLWKQVQLAGAGLGVLCLLLDSCLAMLRSRRLRRTLVRVRSGGADVTAIDRAHAITATAAQASEVHAVSTVWALLGAGVLGTLIPRNTDIAPVLIVAGTWVLGFIALVAVSMRSDAAAPKLREEYGYRLPTQTSGNDNTWH
ncbi:hypothetical protein AB0K64_33535 [Streptomyces sp. NPDC053741]|uniref:Uncharacterized protein n=1 Tax=Streptomyces pratensis (strain ATCC 33331 / IAF-45CD) TaxID=591167 RepID=A0A8D3WQD3_STRFA|nr:MULTISPECIES: hypothetical protein [unclassified Streptomyces]MDX3186422.1 hypothetical protein [Streptomyces sp. ME02-7008A-1]MDX3307172.1 hypothetical protein [Streptomyces sp. ME02-7008A]